MTFWTSVSRTRLALKALWQHARDLAIVAAIGSVMGTIVAWVLVRDEFPGKRMLNSVIDLPFALPTIVASLALLGLYGTGSPVGVNLALTKTIIGVALLFVTLPFVVRSVQPVLLELDTGGRGGRGFAGRGRIRMTFRRIVLPALRPAIVSGTALSFARCMGEYGSIVLLADQGPDREPGDLRRRRVRTGSGNSATSRPPACRWRCW